MHPGEQPADRDHAPVEGAQSRLGCELAHMLTHPVFGYNRCSEMTYDPASLKAAASLAAKLAPTFVEPAKGTLLRAKQRLEVKFRKGFSRYFENQQVRFSKVKTIISSSTPIEMKDIYVNVIAKCKDVAVRDDDVPNAMARFERILFSASAGAGKSMLMRYLFLQFIDVQTDRLPIFLELRDLNSRPDDSIITLSKERIAEYIDDFSEEQLRYALKSGMIVLFLDGFDEIDYDQRKKRERELNELAGRFKELWVFVSSRPSESFASWERFFIFEVQPFTKKQVEMLITKIPYDADMKNLFMKKLDEGLFETHEEFLTNPLLTLMMLITLEHFAEVPTKIHLFYEYAFDALFGRHDVSKGGGFQRKKYTSLALDDFKRLFSYFCTITYMETKIDFGSDEVLEIIERSIRASQIEVNKTAFRNDLTESTCMLVPEGLEYTFSHRSFQEYFVAYFLSRVKVDEFERALPLLVSWGAYDTVLVMLSEMNKEKFEESWALPVLRRLCERVEGIDAEKHPFDFCKKMFGTPVFNLMMGDMTFVYDNKDSIFESRIALYRVYPVFKKIHADLRDSDEVRHQLLDRIRKGKLLAEDPRFESWRSSTAERTEGEVRLTGADNFWLRDTHFGMFVAREGVLLPELRREVELRVNERQRGLQTIFPT